jgi:hypothetical protein
MVPNGQIQPQKKRPRTAEKMNMSTPGKSSQVNPNVESTYVTRTSGLTRKNALAAMVISS